jgi:hypothetical protein
MVKSGARRRRADGASPPRDLAYEKFYNNERLSRFLLECGAALAGPGRPDGDVVDLLP